MDTVAKSGPVIGRFHVRLGVDGIWRHRCAVSDSGALLVCSCPHRVRAGSRPSDWIVSARSAIESIRTRSHGGDSNEMVIG